VKSPSFSVVEFHQHFPDNDACLDYLFQMHFGHKHCPKCGAKGKYHLQAGTSHYVCQCGAHQISPKKATIFEKSDTNLVKWFHAIFLMSQSRNGVAAAEIQRQCGVTYKTAWRMAHQIRKLMQDDPALLSGQVEADETAVGGRHHGKRGRGAAGKTIVFGMLQRKGKVNAMIVPNVKADTLLPHMADNVAKGTHLITDEFWSYKRIARVLGSPHHTVDHGRHEYAKPDGTHTNTIEGFWSQLKRSIDGTHHVVSPKYLPLYVSEFQFRYNFGRDPSVHLFDFLLSRVGLPHVAAAQRIVAYR
jgi:transposase-like protein